MFQLCSIAYEDILGFMKFERSPMSNVEMNTCRNAPIHQKFFIIRNSCSRQRGFQRVGARPFDKATSSDPSSPSPTLFHLLSFRFAREILNLIITLRSSARDHANYYKMASYYIKMRNYFIIFKKRVASDPMGITEKVIFRNMSLIINCAVAFV